MPSTSLWNGQQPCRSLLLRKRCTLIRRLNDELINVCGQSLKLFFTGLKNFLIAKFAPEGFYWLVYMLRCSKADFEEVDFFVWKPYNYEIFRTRAKELLEKLVSVSRDAGRSAAQDSAIIMDSRMSEFKGKLTFVRRAVQ